jgi:hypothetical protein
VPHKDLLVRKAYQEAYRQKHFEKRKLASNIWREKNKESVATNMRIRAYKRLYGITIADYDRMFDEQNGLCAVCGSDKALGRGRRFHVDHDHITGKVRGLLCHLCNTAIGRIERYGDKWLTYLGLVKEP